MAPALYERDHGPVDVELIGDLFLKERPFSEKAKDFRGVVFIYPTDTSVSGLLLFSRPSTIIGLIALVVIFPVQTILRAGTLSHIGKEIDERSRPPIADRDPARAVVVEGLIRRALTASQHITPRAPFRRSGHAVLLASFSARDSH
jgi:hypothetical protein